MSYLQKQMNYLKFDKRLLEMNLKSGTITQAEYEQHMASLVDSEANAAQLDLSADSDHDSMNGSHHPADNRPSTPTMPTNNDPFGSGF